MNPECSKDVSECFPQLLLILLTISINKDDEDAYEAVDADLVHKLNCTVIGKLILVHPDVLGYVFKCYFIIPISVIVIFIKL